MPMKIIDFNLTRESEFVTASARVIFEDCNRPEQKVFIKTLGCQMNVYDSEKMNEVLESQLNTVKTLNFEEFHNLSSPHYSKLRLLLQIPH